MYICKVQGKCVSTIKNKNLSGNSLILVQRMNKSGNLTGETQVAVDTIGCGIGETVLVTSGSAVRALLGMENPSDMAVVGIIDSCDWK